ncbi:hypothetical protein ACWIG3_12020 [Streptomyces celluloflavus]|uniref:Uncharacterized protein n=2 Tax=Streptomyces TaxID=1883 RepID=A0ABW7RFG8_9ACTN|nr:MULTISPECIES: hypothetical protein [Streptomyces]MYU51387.1 hypothetical protein [Streptomyces sp. SID7805]WSK16371.1 hypothetical protein OG717_34310 [Streptomyces celluloflavus]
MASNDKTTFTKQTLQNYRDSPEYLNGLQTGANAALYDLVGFQEEYGKLLPGGPSFGAAVELQKSLLAVDTSVKEQLDTAYNLFNKMVVMLRDTSTSMTEMEDSTAQLSVEQLRKLIGGALQPTTPPATTPPGTTPPGTTPPATTPPPTTEPPS